MIEKWVARVFDDETGELIGECLAPKDLVQIELSRMERRQPPSRPLRLFIAPTGEFYQ